MSMFVTGATGVLGRAVLSRFSKNGKKIHALCRSQANRKTIAELGAIPEELDLYDQEAMTGMLEQCNTVLHLATKIPPSSQLKRTGIWSENDKIRRDGMASIARAARRTGTVKTILYPSISYFYGDGGSRWLNVDNAASEPTSFLSSTLEAEKTVMEFARGSAENRGIVLRYGGFYGPDSPDSLQNFGLAAKGFFMPLANPDTYRSMIWIDDAADAVVEAIANAPSGTYDVTENTPMTQNQAAEAMASAVGRAKLRALPRMLKYLFLTGELRRLVERSQRISNAKFCEVTSWKPEVPSQAEGWHLLSKLAG